MARNAWQSFSQVENAVFYKTVIEHRKLCRVLTRMAGVGYAPFEMRPNEMRPWDASQLYGACVPLCPCLPTGPVLHLLGQQCPFDCVCTQLIVGPR